MIDLHRHDERSLFDGFGKPAELVVRAKELGHTSLGLSNHGDMSGLVGHYFGCKNAEIKPVMGNEVYFQPQFKQVRRSFHLCLFIKNIKGYKNLNKMVTYANKKQYYYKPIVDFDLLEKYSDGLICTSACVGGILSQLIIDGEKDKATRCAKKFVKIFGDDFYIEIQPYKLTDKGLQESTNIGLIEIAEELGIKCILTSDSHFSRKEDFDTYLKMHEIAGHAEFGEQYSERYIPSEKALIKRFVKMHGDDFPNAEKMAKKMIANLEEIEDKVDEEILEKLELRLPVFKDGIDSKKLLMKEIKEGLKAKGKYKKEYLDRCKEEYDVICYHGFEDYFLIVQDYVRWAKNRGIEVGPGRGSVCNCLLAYALDITDVDSLFFDLDFRRFLRMDKKKLPDIDLDFETERRAEVIEYIVNTYKGNAVRICSYGLYKVDILVNDLVKVCGLGDPDKKEEYYAERKKEIDTTKKQIKAAINKYIDKETGNFDYEAAKQDSDIMVFNKLYDNIIVHFSKLYKKVRFYGTHAAGVAVSGLQINNYTAIERRAKEAYTTSYDLIDIEQINAVKFDMLGLRTMSILKELRELTGQKRFNDEWLYDEKIYEQFGLANTDGIFQFEAKGAKSVLQAIDCDCYEDVFAASALNRPGPLSLGMVEQYAESKDAARDHRKIKANKDNIFFDYAKDTYGCFVYQEQIMKICVELGKMTWADADKTLKFLKAGGILTEKALREKMAEESRLTAEFAKGAAENGISEKLAKEIFKKILVYAFNKGHTVGYGLISIEQMFYKVYHPMEFWYVTLKYANDLDLPRLSAKAVKDNAILLLPHVNGTCRYSLEKVDGELAIREGMSSVKNVGEKAAEFIEQDRLENGKYKSYDDFISRMEPYKRIVNKRAIDALEEGGALEFNEKVYYSRVSKYNSSLYSRG